MRKGGSLRNVSDWVEFNGDQPPMILSVFFWGSAIISVLVFVAGYLAADRFIPHTWQLADPLFLLSAAALAPACALWPFLPWSRSAPMRLRCATVLFLVLTLMLMLMGGFATLILVSLAIGNAVTVFGAGGGIGYTAAATLFNVTLSAMNPRQSVIDAIINGSVVLFLCLAVLIVFLALLEARRRAQDTRRLLADLEAAHSELHRYGERSRELSVAEERARMARDMHDTIGHYLTVINMGLSNAQRFRTARPDAAWDEVRQAQDLTREALTDTRRWVRALKPLRMEGRAGEAAMRALAASFESTGAPITFRVEGEWPDVHEAHEVVCYRVLQEGLTNALRHARAHRIDAVLSCAPERVVLTVSDDGEGAGTDTVPVGFGLRGLRERVEAVGGALDARDSAGGGFTLWAEIPTRPTRFPAAAGVEATA